MDAVVVLGPISAWSNGAVLELRGRKQRVLLALLAVAEGRPVPVERLTEALWDDAPPADPVHALQAQISRLRRTLALPQGAVVASHRGYRLALQGVTLDAARFTELARSGRAALREWRTADAARELREALALWRGPAFGDLADLPELRARATALEQERLQAIIDRVDADLALGDHADLVAELEGLVTEHPLREQLWTRLLLALFRSGRQADALEVFRRARAELAEHAGLEPGPELRAAHEAALRQRDLPPVPMVAPSDAPGAPVGGPDALPAELARRLNRPFAGRDRELAMLRAAWADGAPQQRLVLVSGEPGIGKTRLAAEFADEVRRTGGAVRFGRCDEGLHVPYQPFVEALGDDLARTPTRDLLARLGAHAGDLTSLVPELADRLPDDRRPIRSDPQTERYRLFEAVASWLGAASRTGPLLLVLDDLQWASEPTLLLLRHVVRSREPMRITIVATSRDDAEATALEEVVADLQRDREQVSHVVLSGLSRGALTEILTGELPDEPTRSDEGHPTSSDLVARVERDTGGNPFFAVELARELADMDRDRQPGATTDGDLPRRVLDVVRQRIRRLASRTSTLLTCAAVAGSPFDARIVQTVSGLDDEELDDALTEATRARLVEADPSDALRLHFAHELVRVSILRDLPPLRLARTHRRTGEAIERHHLADLPAHFTALAHHFSEAAVIDGRVGPAIDYLRSAGDTALASHAAGDAVDLYGRAVRLLPAHGDAATRCDLLTSLGVAQLRAGDRDHRTTLVQAAELAKAHDDPRRLATAVIVNSRGWSGATASVDETRVALLDAALASCDPAEHAIRARLLSGLAVETVVDPARRLQAVATSTEAVALARERDDLELLATVLNDHYSVVYASFTDPRGCLDISATLVELARDLADPAFSVMADLSHAQAALLCADVATSDRFLDRAERALAVLDQPARRWMARTWRAMRLHLRGRFAEAETVATEAFELGAATGQPDAGTWFAGQLFTFRWDQGRLGELIDLIEDQVVTQSDGIPAWRAAYAVALTEVGRLEEAESILDEFAATQLDILPRDALWLAGMSYLCTVCANVGRPDVATMLHDALAPFHGLLAGNGVVNAGPIDLHLGAMSALAGHRERAAQQLAAARATCERIDAPVWLGRVDEARGRLAAA